MKYYVKMSCGHAQLMTINGCAEHISKKIKYFETHAMCKCCFMKKRLKEMKEPVEVRMTYHAYKTYYRNFPCDMDSYNTEDMTIIVYLDKEFADRYEAKETAKEKARLERAEKKRLAEQRKAERAAARADALAAKPAKPKPVKPAKPTVPQKPIILRPLEASIFLKRLALEYNKKYSVAVTELQRRDVRCAFGRLHLFYSSCSKKEWEQLVANHDIVNMPAHKIVQLAHHFYDNTEKDSIGCVKR